MTLVNKFLINAKNLQYVSILIVYIAYGISFTLFSTFMHFNISKYVYVFFCCIFTTSQDFLMMRWRDDDDDDDNGRENFLYRLIFLFILIYKFFIFCFSFFFFLWCFRFAHITLCERYKVIIRTFTYNIRYNFSFILLKRKRKIILKILLELLHFMYILHMSLHIQHKIYRLMQLALYVDIKICTNRVEH